MGKSSKTEGPPPALLKSFVSRQAVFIYRTYSPVCTSVPVHDIRKHQLEVLVVYGLPTNYSNPLRFPSLNLSILDVPGQERCLLGCGYTLGWGPGTRHRNGGYSSAGVAIWLDRTPCVQLLKLLSGWAPSAGLVRNPTLLPSSVANGCSWVIVPFILLISPFQITSYTSRSWWSSHMIPYIVHLLPRRIQSLLSSHILRACHLWAAEPF